MVQDENLYDVIVIGGGPAGLTAGLYLARARYRVLILEKADFGGQITITDEVVNYPGVGTTSGRALTATMRRQAQDFGAEFLSAEATGLDVEGDVKVVHTSRGDLRTFGILVATGASPRKLGFEGESEYAGRGVAYCATCDGEFFTGREVLVIGGGFAAAEEAVFLTKYASKVTILVREDDFTCDASVAAEAKDNAVATRRIVLLGTNQYPNFNETADKAITAETVTPAACEGKVLRPYRGGMAFEQLRLKVDRSGKAPGHHRGSLHDCYYRLLHLDEVTTRDLELVAETARRLGRPPERREIPLPVRRRLQAACGSWSNALYQLGLQPRRPG